MKKIILLVALSMLAISGAAICFIMKWYPNTVAGEAIVEYAVKARDLGVSWYEVSKEHVIAAWKHVRGTDEQEPPKVVKEQEKPTVEPQAKDAPAPEEKPAAPKAVEPPPEEPPHWTGFESANWCAGRKIDASALKGKIVMVYEFSVAESDSVDLLPRIQQLWDGYSTKPFVVVASHRGGKSSKVAAAAKKAKLTIPVYEGAGWSKEPKGTGFPIVYVVNDAGKVIYRGRSELGAIEAVVNALPLVGKRR